jgi:hypothetical protein
MRHLRHGALLAAMVALIPAAAGQAASRARAPVTLATVAGGVFGVAQDGRRVAWMDRCGPVLLSAGRVARLGAPINPNPARCYIGLAALAVAGTRVLWASDFGGNHREIAVTTQALAHRAQRTLERELGDTTSAENGAVFGGAASDGSVLAYATSGFDDTDAEGVLGTYCDDYYLPCRVTAERGKTVLVDERGHTTSRAGGGTSIALDAGRIATATTIPARGPCTCAATPAWSPDGTELVFAGGWTSDGSSLYVKSAHGGALRRLTTRDDVVDAEPDWSPDGSRIVFAREPLPASGGARKPTSAIEVVPAAGGAATRLARGRDPAWSPDGSRIAYVRTGPASQAGLYTMDASGGAQKLVVRGDDLWSPTWSPDGARLAFISSHEGPVSIVAAHGGTPRPLAGGPKQLGAVRWTHDGKQLLLWAMYSQDPAPSSVQAYDFASRTVAQIADGEYVGAARDGSVVYVDTRLDVLHVMGPDGIDIRQLPLPATHRRYPIELRRARDSRLVATVDAGGPVLGLALGRSFVAATLAHRVVVFALPGGALRATLPLKHERDRSLRPWIPTSSASGSRLVFADGLAIELYDAATGRTTTIAHAHTRPVGLSIVGRRVVWAEDRRNRFGDLVGPGRVLSLDVG